MTAVFVAACMLLGSPQKATMTVDVNVKNGDIVRGEREFIVSVKTEEIITQVEFYVNGDLRDNDTSKPYKFSIDTLTESDGKIPVEFKSYTSKGTRAGKKVTIVIDNGVSKGAQFHVEEGLKFLQDSKWNDALLSGRIAMKADSDFNPARIVLARANLGLGQIDKAQKFAEDAVTKEPKSIEALNLLSNVNVRRAFGTFNRSANKSESIGTINNAFIAAATTRRKALEAGFDLVSPATDANLLAYADAAFRAGLYSTAIQPLAKAFTSDNRRVEVGNRLIYAYLRTSKLIEASEVLAQLQKFGKPNAYTFGAAAILAVEKSNDAAADEFIKRGLLEDSSDFGVRTAEAYIALKRNRTGVLARLSSDLNRDFGNQSEVYFYLIAIFNRGNQYSQSRRFFELAMRADAADADALLEQTGEALDLVFTGRVAASERGFQLASARGFAQAALAAQDNSASALAALAMVSLMESKYDEAVKFGEAATLANPNYAGAQYILSAVYRGQLKQFEERNKGRSLTESQQKFRFDVMKRQGDANKRAGELDPRNLQGRELPNDLAAYRYFISGGRLPVFARPR